MSAPLCPRRRPSRATRCTSCQSGAEAEVRAAVRWRRLRRPRGSSGPRRRRGKAPRNDPADRDGARGPRRGHQHLARGRRPGLWGAEITASGALLKAHDFSRGPGPSQWSARNRPVSASPLKTRRLGVPGAITSKCKSSVELFSDKSPVWPYLAYSPRVLLSVIRVFVRLPSNWFPQMRGQPPLLFRCVRQIAELALSKTRGE